MLITFANEKEKETTIKERWTDNWFDELRSWDGEAAQMERLVWLHCYGMPLNVWNVPSFKEIGGKWGDFLEVDDKTLRQEALDKARILIATEYEGKIDSSVHLKINGKIYVVRVKEMETFSILEQEPPANTSMPEVEHDELEKSKNVKDDRLDNLVNLANDLAWNRKLDGDKIKDGAINVVSEDALNAGDDRLIEACQQIGATDQQVGAADQLSSVPIQHRSKDLEVNEAFMEENSNSYHGLDSLVEDSGGIINETWACLHKSLQLQAQEFEAQSKESLVDGNQNKGAEDNSLVNGDKQEEIERNLLLLDGPVVLGSISNTKH